MNTKDLIRLGVPAGEPIQLAHEFIQNFIAQGNDGALLEAEVFNIVANPPAFRPFIFKAFQRDSRLWARRMKRRGQFEIPWASASLGALARQQPQIFSRWDRRAP
jgi:hypothetical protein